MIHLKRFNEGIKWNKDRPVLLKFCEEHLAYLLDEGFDVSVRLHKMENSAYKNGIRDEGYISLTSNKENNVFKRNSFKWNDVKEDLIPFLEMLIIKYELDYSKIVVEFIPLIGFPKIYITDDIKKILDGKLISRVHLEEIRIKNW